VAGDGTPLARSGSWLGAGFHGHDFTPAPEALVLNVDGTQHEVQLAAHMGSIPSAVVELNACFEQQNICALASVDATTGWLRLQANCPGHPGRLKALSVFLCKSGLYGAFVWARKALNSQKRRFPARAAAGEGSVVEVGVGINSIVTLEKELPNMIGNLV
jgi:hypothetical protein